MGGMRGGASAGGFASAPSYYSQPLLPPFVSNTGHERTVSEAADLLYHAFVLLNHEGVKLEEVTAELRRRFGMSGLDEKASRAPKQ